MKLSTRMELIKDIKEKLLMEIRFHDRDDCTCIYCDLDKIIKNMYETGDEGAELRAMDYAERGSAKYALELKKLREPQFVEIDDKKRQELGLINCPFCGPKLVSKLVKKYDKYIKDEFVLDCGHFLYRSPNIAIGPEHDQQAYASGESTTAENVFKEWRKKNPYSSDIEWCKRNPRLVDIVRRIENRSS